MAPLALVPLPGYHASAARLFVGGSHSSARHYSFTDSEIFASGKNGDVLSVGGCHCRGRISITALVESRPLPLGNPKTGISGLRQSANRGDAALDSRQHAQKQCLFD